MMDFVIPSSNFITPKRNKIEKLIQIAASTGINCRTNEPARSAIPNTRLHVILMMRLESRGILILLLPYAKLAESASTEQVRAIVAACIAEKRVIKIGTCFLCLLYTIRRRVARLKLADSDEIVYNWMRMLCVIVSELKRLAK